MKKGRLLPVIIIEIVWAFFSWFYCQGSVVVFISWFSSQIPLLVWILVISRRPKTTKKPYDPNNINIISLFTPVLVFAAIIIWGFLLFPFLVKSTVNHSGRAALAYPSSYHYLYYDFGFEFGVTSEALNSESADSVKVKIYYDNHTTNLLLDKGREGFNEAKQANLYNKPLKVRYLSWAPAIVLPDTR